MYSDQDSIYFKYTDEEIQKHAEHFYNRLQKRRSVREFSIKSFPVEIVNLCLQSAGTAPSGANKQPWHFVVVQNPEIKIQIRKACEKVEYEFYHGAAGDEWLKDLKELGTNFQKPFLEEAPYLIVVFAEKFGVDSEGKRTKNYYVNESIGISIGILITALHNCGLNFLTYTPIRMGFLRDILNRPENERPVMILVVGHATDHAKVPNLHKKEMEEYISWY